MPTSALKGSALLGLNAKGLVILHPESRVPLFFASYHHIISMANDSNTTSGKALPRGVVQVIVKMSPVLLPPDTRSKVDMSKHAPVVAKLLSQYSDCLLQVLQHHVDLYATMNPVNE